MEQEIAIRKFLNDYQFRLQPRTLKDYHRAVKQLADYIEKPLEDTSKRDIRNYLTHLLDKGYKPNTIKYRLSGFKTFFTYCVEEGLTQDNPAKNIPFPQDNERVPRYLTREQITQVRELVQGNLKERVIIEVLYATGARIGELVAMKKNDINWVERSILITEGKGGKERMVLFTKECAEYLSAYLNTRTDDLPFLIVNPFANKSIDDGWIHKKFQGYSKELGFRITPHMLRHTFAVHLVQKGMPLEALRTLLGHDWLETTRLYTRLSNHSQKEMYDEWM